jgi:chromosome segregation ATPase
MLEKVDYFMKIYASIFKELNVQNIQLLLLYNSNRIKNYQDTIELYIAKHRKLIDEYFKKYNVYFNILYIYPSIGKIVLNQISDQILNMEINQKQNKNEIEKLKKQQQEKEKRNKFEIEELKIKNKMEIEKLKKEQQEKDKINKNEIERLKRKQQEQQEKEEKNQNEIKHLKKNNEILYKKIKELTEQMEKLNNEFNISKKTNGDKEKIDNKNSKLNELKQISVNNEVENKPNNNDIKNAKNNEKRESYNASKTEEIIDKDLIHLKINEKMNKSNNLSNKEKEYLRLFYYFKNECKNNNIDIDICPLSSLIENHGQNDKICEIFHSCAKKITLDNLKEYHFQKCSRNDCPFNPSVK